ncbi:MAG: nucleotidyltransferase domain-containing protein [bacterium]
MLSEKTLEVIKKRLIKIYNPLKIYIFGSYAWGNPTEDSDLDLLIVVEDSNEKTYRRPIKGHVALSGIDTPKDLIIYTKQEFEERSGDITTLCYKVKNEGKVIYAKA